MASGDLNEQIGPLTADLIRQPRHNGIVYDASFLSVRWGTLSTLLYLCEAALFRWLGSRSTAIERGRWGIECSLAGQELPSSIEAFVERYLGSDRQLTLRLA